MSKSATSAVPAAVGIPWQQRPHHTIQTASQIAGLSRASLYACAKQGRLTLRRLAGRTLVTTESLIAFINSAEEWKPSDRGSGGRAARAERARAAWEA